VLSSASAVEIPLIEAIPCARRALNFFAADCRSAKSPPSPCRPADGHRRDSDSQARRGASSPAWSSRLARFRENAYVMPHLIA